MSRRLRSFLPITILLAGHALSARGAAQSQPPGSTGGNADQSQSAGFKEQVEVVGITPLPGLEVPATEVPSPVQTANARAIEESGALDVADFLNRQFTGVHVNETQSNPFQPDVSYRGYTASPLLGTPQGLSVYMDGVRLNQPFGDVVSWDLIPKIAIGSTTLMPGSNPLFGLNTLGGALSLQTKDGRTQPGTTFRATYGSSVRRSIEAETGGQSPSKRFHWYAAGTLFGEDGWRDESPSDVRQLFGKVGWERDRGNLLLSGGHTVNSLYGNGLQEFRMLSYDNSSVYTKPDVTDNRSTVVNVSTTARVSPHLSLTAHGYYRDLGTSTLNGDINEDSLGTSSAIHNGLINRGHSEQHNGGLSGQVTHRSSPAGRENRLTGGAGFDRSNVGFSQATELGYLTPDRSVTGVGPSGDDGESGGAANDGRVDLSGEVVSWSLYATDTLAVSRRARLTVAGRFDRTSIANRDGINPGGGTGSLDGDHVYSRLNPSAGLTVDLSPRVNAYAGYSEGSRAATSIELGCADPDAPCKLPNAMAGDPPLDQVVTRTIEGGVRGTHGAFSWNAGLFRAANHDDILFVTSEQTGFGYFRNFGETRRQGLEAGARTRAGRVTFGAGYTWLRATFESEETVNGESNSTNDAAAAGRPGFEGSISIVPGDRLPFVPAHTFKAYSDVTITAKLSVDLDLIAASESIARGNENNQHEPDGTYYLGTGRIAGYAVLNLGARYDITRRVQIVAQISNLFDRAYATAAQLGVTGFTPEGQFVARPLPAVDGEFPLVHSTFVAPGAPRRGWVSLRLRF